MELSGVEFSPLEPLAGLCPEPIRGPSGPLDSQQIFQYPPLTEILEPPLIQVPSCGNTY
ncbi:hypothetical protein DPMN_030993 [Dreissena polymorpha]|uniref:Uncharacterized protein n=1 Tax=Dreissena polymorpha TaxID=45954 RepID=A0A9D4RGP2_DREPO|nr:hypothetical protein DPMN_030993 [Dreissena polymorpha]